MGKRPRKEAAPPIPVAVQDHGHYGFVYFAEADCGRVVKIGHAMVPSKRLKALSKIAGIIYGNVKIRYLAVICGSWKDERAIHGRFASARVGDEWFWMTEEIRAYIETLRPQFVAPELWTATEKDVRAIMAPPKPPPPPPAVPWDASTALRWCRRVRRHLVYCPVDRKALSSWTIHKVANLDRFSTKQP
jgi:hypothetical protein